MSEQATLQSIARLGHRKDFPLIYRAAARTPAASHSKRASGLRLGYGITLSAPPGALSVTLTNAEKQARYRERHLGVDGEKVASGSLSTRPQGENGAALHATEVIQ
jgi:hypothetical protein